MNNRARLGLGLRLELRLGAALLGPVAGRSVGRMSVIFCTSS